MAEEQNNRQAMLKTSFFGGFDKKEVLAYIDRLREENNTAQASLDAQLQEVTAARGELAEQVNGFEEKIREMEAQLSERSDRIRSMTGQIDQLESDLTETRKKQDDTGRALRLQEEQNRFLAERVQRSEKQAEKYEKISAELGDMILTAQHTADKVVADANKEAQQLRKEATSAGERLSVEFDAMREELSHLRVQMAELVESFSNRITEAEELIDHLQERTAGGKPVSEKVSETPRQEAHNNTQAHTYPAAHSSRSRTRTNTASDFIDRLLSRR